MLAAKGVVDRLLTSEYSKIPYIKSSRGVTSAARITSRKSIRYYT